MQQSTSSINITQAGGDATFKYGKFHLNGRVLFQSAINNKDLMPMPGFVGRANVYFQSKVFKDAAEVQAGLKHITSVNLLPENFSRYLTSLCCQMLHQVIL